MPSHWNDQRLRGSAAVKQRQRRLNIYPICAHCRDEGVTKLTDEIDHIIPLGQGGEDTDENCQGLCFHHHRLKTATEDVAHGGAATHPDWLKPSVIPLTIITGPPCAGKTTYLELHAGPNDITIDLDGILTELKPGYRHWTGGSGGELLTRAIRTRNAILGSLSRQDSGRAWFIVSAPHPKERDWWQRKLGGTIVHLHPGVDECKRRAIKRGTPKAVQGIDRWEKASRSPWTPPESRPPKRRFNPDGTPEGWE